MAIDLLSHIENSSLGISPRISFSYDLCQTDLAAIQRPRSDSLLLESNDFDFCTSQSFELDVLSSSAEELFSNGKILPQDFKKQQNLPPKPPAHQNPKKESLKEIIENSYKTEDTEKSSKPSSSSRSFWRFKRSTSCGDGYKRSLICSLPLLLRSNSTGSAPNPNPKPTTALKNNNAQRQQKVQTKSPFNGYPYSTQNKNGMRVSPVLNVPPPYISRGTVSLFGLGSLFCNGKDKKKKSWEMSEEHWIGRKRKGIVTSLETKH